MGDWSQGKQQDRCIERERSRSYALQGNKNNIHTMYLIQNWAKIRLGGGKEAWVCLDHCHHHGSEDAHGNQVVANQDDLGPCMASTCSPSPRMMGRKKLAKTS
jgi:hypothetical protein